MKKFMIALVIVMSISSVQAIAESKEIYQFPAAWEWKDAPIQIFSDGTTDFDVSAFKNRGGKNIYVSTSGKSTNDGLSALNPAQSLHKAYLLASDNDTIIVMDGDYKRSSLFQGQKIDKNINIIAQNTGKARFFNADDHVYTKTKGYSRIYETARSNVSKVVDIQGTETIEYKFVKSMHELSKSSGGWYTDGKIVYINTLDGAPPTNQNIAVLLHSQSQIYVDSEKKNVNLYIEGIEIYGGSTGNVYFANSPKFTKPRLYMKDVVARYGRGNATNGNSISVIGAEYAFTQNVEASFAQKDGFNYQPSNGTIPKVIEVNVVGRNNGDNTILGTENMNNGSSMHGGGKIIRIGGKYYENMGGNVADVHVGTQSICIRCEAHSSKSTDRTMNNSDFTTQQADAEMWIIDSKAYGSEYSLAYYTGTKIHIINTEYRSKAGGGELIIQN